MTAPVHVAVGDRITASGENNEQDFWSGAGQAYTPTLNAVTTNPTLGAGSSQVGRFVQVGKLVVAHAEIVFGTSGTAAGSGLYSISLPVTPRTPTSQCVIGQGRIRAAGLNTPVYVLLSASGAMTLNYTSASVNGTESAAGSAAPGAWTANDQLRIAFYYEAA